MSKRKYELSIHEEPPIDSFKVAIVTAVIITLLISFVFFMVSPLLPWGVHSDLTERIVVLENVIQMANNTRRTITRDSHEMPSTIDMRNTHAYINAAGVYLNGKPIRFTDLYDVNTQSITAGQPIVWHDEKVQTINVTAEIHKGAAGGVAPLDENSLIPLQYLPDVARNNQNGAVNVTAALLHSQLTSGNPHGVTKHDVGLSNVLNTKNTFDASVAPDANTDASMGYTPGSIITVAATQSAWIAYDVTIGLAKWRRIDGMIPPAQPSVASGSVALFDGTTGLLLKDSTVQITNGGNLVLDGLVDGRDVSTDGTALDAHVGNAPLHRQIDDASVPSSTTLWSSAKTATELFSKAASAHVHAAVDVSDFNTAVSTVITARCGIANGLATLDINGKLPAEQLGLSALTVFRGTWNAQDNTPTLLANVCLAGDYYIVKTAGSTQLGATLAWGIGDWAMCATLNTWTRIASVAGVASVAGKTGTVTLDTTDIGTGTFADARISLSSVTQYQSALQIAGTQIAANPTLNGYIQLSNMIEPMNGADGTGRLYKKQNSAGLFWKPDSGSAEVNLAAPAAGLTLLEVSSVAETMTSSVAYSPLADMSIVPSAAGTYKVDFSATAYMDESKNAKAYFVLYVGGVMIPHTKRQLFLPSGHRHSFYAPVHISALVTVNGAQSVAVHYRCHETDNVLHVYERSMQLLK